MSQRGNLKPLLVQANLSHSFVQLNVNQLYKLTL